MRIDSVGRIDKAYQMQNQTLPAKTKKVSQDEVALSTTAVDTQQAYKLVKKVPDIRAEKVEAIKAQLAKGEYRIDTEALSKKIMDLTDRDQ